MAVCYNKLWHILIDKIQGDYKGSSKKLGACK